MTNIGNERGGSITDFTDIKRLKKYYEEFYNLDKNKVLERHKLPKLL